MLTHTPLTPLTPQRSQVDYPADPEPASLPVDPDEGPVLPDIPEDPEHDRLVDPEVGDAATPMRTIE